ncbi:hypothetical protein C8R45DRAFT_948092 [Mycena sanguinolenta]|nr:hypothetical protein C8R45DRAFT_948092 [Mycena sanguinolenta]
MKFTPFALSVLFESVALAQNVFVTSPAPGSTVTILIQFHRGAFSVWARAVGPRLPLPWDGCLVAESNEPCNTSPLSFLGVVIYNNGPFAPNFINSEAVPSQNFTLTVPTWATPGSALLQIAHFVLTGERRKHEAEVGPLYESSRPWIFSQLVHGDRSKPRRAKRMARLQWLSHVHEHDRSTLEEKSAEFTETLNSLVLVVFSFAVGPSHEFSVPAMNSEFLAGASDIIACLMGELGVLQRNLTEEEARVASAENARRNTEELGLSVLGITKTALEITRQRLANQRSANKGLERVAKETQSRFQGLVEEAAKKEQELEEKVASVQVELQIIDVQARQDVALLRKDNVKLKLVVEAKDEVLKRVSEELSQAQAQSDPQKAQLSTVGPIFSLSSDGGEIVSSTDAKTTPSCFTRGFWGAFSKIATMANARHNAARRSRKWTEQQLQNERAAHEEVGHHSLAMSVPDDFAELSNTNCMKWDLMIVCFDGVAQRESRHSHEDILCKYERKYRKLKKKMQEQAELDLDVRRSSRGCGSGVCQEAQSHRDVGRAKKQTAYHPMRSRNAACSGFQPPGPSDGRVEKRPFLRDGRGYPAVNGMFLEGTFWVPSEKGSDKEAINPINALYRLRAFLDGDVTSLVQILPLLVGDPSTRHGRGRVCPLTGQTVPYPAVKDGDFIA